MAKKMVRTQVYLPIDLKKRVKHQAALLHTNLSEYVRVATEKAIAAEEDSFEQRKKRAREALRNIAGIWKDRDDIDFKKIREQSNHRFPEWSKRP